MFEHLCIVTKDKEQIKDFYQKYFGGKFRTWTSEDGTMCIYYLVFENGAVIEIEGFDDIAVKAPHKKESQTGFDHIAFRVDSREEVDALTKRISEDGHTIVSWPTDYGTKEFYESCLRDPDGNLVEIGIDPGLFD